MIVRKCIGLAILSALLAIGAQGEVDPLTGSATDVTPKSGISSDYGPRCRCSEAAQLTRNLVVYALGGTAGGLAGETIAKACHAKQNKQNNRNIREV